MKKGRVVITLIIAPIFKLAINLPDRTSMVRLVTEVNYFTLLVLPSIRSAVKTCGTIWTRSIFFLGSRTIEKDRLRIEDQWKKADINVLRVGSLTTSSQPPSCRFTHGPSGEPKLFSLNDRIGKAFALL